MGGFSSSDPIVGNDPGQGSGGGQGNGTHFEDIEDLGNANAAKIKRRLKRENSNFRNVTQRWEHRNEMRIGLILKAKNAIGYIIGDLGKCETSLSSAITDCEMYESACGGGP